MQNVDIIFVAADSSGLNRGYEIPPYPGAVRTADDNSVPVVELQVTMLELITVCAMISLLVVTKQLHKFTVDNPRIATLISDECESESALTLMYALAQNFSQNL